MKSSYTRIVPFCVLFATLSACKGDKSHKTNPDSQLEAVETATTEKFNLAKFIHENPKTARLSASVGPSDAYLFFGEKNRFRIETNLNVDTQGEKGYIFGGPRAISAAYWLDGYVFGRRIGKNADRGFLVDLGATGDLETSILEAHIRFLGEDKYVGKVEGLLDKSFVRDLNFDQTIYPVPLLGLTAEGNIAGELGLVAQMGVKAPNAMSLEFRPKIDVNAGLSASVKLLKFASAEVKGSAEVLNLEIASAANMGFLKEANYSYGNTGVDGGQLKALDGKIEIFANAEVKGVLPGGIDKKLWVAALKTVGIEDTKWDWQHTVWNPDPIIEKDIPQYGNSFMKFVKMPDSLADCKTKVALVSQALDNHAAKLTANSASLSGMDAIMSKNSLAALDEIKAKVALYCKQY